MKLFNGTHAHTLAAQVAMRNVHAMKYDSEMCVHCCCVIECVLPKTLTLTLRYENANVQCDFFAFNYYELN